MFITKLRNKVLSLPKLHTAEAQGAGRGNLHLAVLDETENYEDRIGYDSLQKHDGCTIFHKILAQKLLWLTDAYTG